MGLWTIWVKSPGAYSVGAVLHSCAKDMTITICHNKPPDKKWAGVWMTSCPEEMVLRIWGFWKDVSWILTIERCSWVFDHWRWDLSFLLLRHVVEFFGSRLTEMNWDLKHHKMHRPLGWGQHSMVSKDFKELCLSLLVSPWTKARN